MNTNTRFFRDLGEEANSKFSESGQSITPAELVELLVRLVDLSFMISILIVTFATRWSVRRNEG